MTDVQVAMDEQAFVLQPYGGISRYVVELVRAFDADPALGVNIDLPFTRVWSEPAIAGLPERGLRRGPRLAEPWPLLAWTAVRPRRRATGPGRPALVHHTFTGPRWLRDYPGVPKVVTVYDMIPERYPGLSRGRSPHLRKRDYVGQADLVLCISESTKRDLLDVYGKVDARLEVVPLAVDARFRPDAPRPTGLPERFVLYAGRRGDYKNFATLLTAFRDLAPKHPGLYLLAIGGGPWTEAERTALTESRLADRAIATTVPDDDVPGVYAAAVAVAVPSRYEGFGLPVLEGMASGIPVLAADATSLPEVAGDAALLLPPDSPEAWAEGLDQVLSDEALRVDLVSRGLARAAGFTWHRTAEGTAAAYRRVLDGGSGA